MDMSTDYDRQVIKIWHCGEYYWLAVSADIIDDCDTLYYGLIIYPGGARELTYWSQFSIDKYNGHCAIPILWEKIRTEYGTLAEELAICLRESASKRKRRRNAK